MDVPEPGDGANPDWIRLQATFPDDLPTHCRTQIYHLDEQRLLRRLDYTAEVVGGLERAAHLCEGYKDFDGIKAPTRRRVLPLMFGKNPLPGPTLVAIDIHDIQLIR